ncbi:hypothetical protein CONLIGDRAFT_127685 [Coniochaeta ligniaria NRRL 30616]|uniref:Uncharacterized protein n=1 Tax=Coniochaeta ligniaria NRRL 30616 TaxID=1408157 RepID=A0A1J7I7I6_9PEZI|nr:hypothetical protein CONLIGDRAFT_127685 [Coniochaeta ligniaria NRRL 30616]
MWTRRFRTPMDCCDACPGRHSGLFRDNVLFKRLLQMGSQEDGTCRVSVRAQWKPLRYFQTHLGEPAPYYTFTKSPANQVHVATCADYVRTTWGDRAVLILRAIMEGFALEKKFCHLEFDGLAVSMFYRENPLSTQLAEGEPKICEPPLVKTFEARGNRSDVADALEQFAWMMSTLRVPKVGQTCWSNVHVEFDWMSRTFELVACPLRPLDRLPPWTDIGAHIAEGGVIASGFPVACRSTHQDVDAGEGDTDLYKPGRFIQPRSPVLPQIPWKVFMHVVPARDMKGRALIEETYRLPPGLYVLVSDEKHLAHTDPESDSESDPVVRVGSGPLLNLDWAVGYEPSTPTSLISTRDRTRETVLLSEIMDAMNCTLDAGQTVTLTLCPVQHPSSRVIVPQFLDDMQVFCNVPGEVTYSHWAL